ncbi:MULTISPECIES: DUF4019 domain-containing protein [unclassified Caulobacter]|uniref:DUF4019 domain-containing protein n=1 Tax=unclassified Caulobacter TaxID=2648921 RepID=UPI0004A7779B|nr:DUF4019 domain-containing protein [Caulobacter sp. UNC358MFTsu5.1]
MEDPPKRSFITGEIDVKALIAFVFGAIFIITILAFATIVKNPSSTAIWTYRVILALAAGGVAAILPGFIDVKYKSFVQAGGAIGVFVLVLMAFPTPSPAPEKPAATEKAAEAPSQASGQASGQAAPPTASQPIVWPTEDPDFVARKYVELVDNEKYLEAYEQIDKSIGIPWATFEASYKAGHAPLGVAEDRRQTGAKREIDPPGKAKGGYAIVTYQTKFAKEAKCREEVVALRAMPDNSWRVAKHESSPQLVDCIGL